MEIEGNIKLKLTEKHISTIHNPQIFSYAKRIFWNIFFSQLIKIKLFQMSLCSVEYQ